MTVFRMTPFLVGAAVAASFLNAQSTPSEKGNSTPVGAKARSAVCCKASQLIGLPITNSKNESLGEIEDIVLDSANSHIAYAVVGFGGFLGMGEKYFAMPWRVIEISQRGAEDKPRATLGLDRDTLKAAPGFDKSNWPDMANASWAGQVDEYYRSRHEARQAEGAVEPKGSALDGSRGIDRKPGSAGFVHRRLSKMIGLDVVDLQHKKLAAVEDLIVDAQYATVEAFLLSYGGTLGLGEKLVLVPAESLRLDPQREAYVLPCTTTGLDTMALKDGKLPVLNSDAWLVNSRELCAKACEGQHVVKDTFVAKDASGVPAANWADAYNAKSVETVQGVVTTVGVVRVGDRNEARVRLRIMLADGREVIVHGAPAAFAPQEALALRTGTSVAVTGSAVRYGTQTVLVAGTITAGGKTANLRDEQGLAAWAKQ